MFVPLGDYPNPRKPQWVTRILIGINVALYLFVTLPLSRQPLTVEDWQEPANRQAFADLAQRRGGSIEDLEEDPHLRARFLRATSRYSLIVQKYGYKPGRFELLALLSCMFLHANFLHLGGNMLYLWIFGDNVEYRLGRLGYLVTYLGTGVVATLAFVAFNPASIVPLVGASGAISGVLGLYLVWFPHNQVRVFLWAFVIFFVHVRAVWVLLAYLVIDNLLPFVVQPSDASGVAHAAHLGGFLAGMGAAWILNRLRGVVPAPRPPPRFERRGGPWRETPVRPAEDTGAVFATAIRQGRMEDAAHSFSTLVREGGTPPAAADVFQLGRWLYEQGFVPDTAAVFRFYIKSYPRGEDLDRVHLGLGILLARKLGQPTAAREHLLQAIDLTEPGSGIATTAREELGRL